jgi:hypothetical protein
MRRKNPQKFSTGCGNLLWKKQKHPEKLEIIRVFARLFAIFLLFLQVFHVGKKQALWKTGGKEKSLDKRKNFAIIKV